MHIRRLFQAILTSKSMTYVRHPLAQLLTFVYPIVIFTPGCSSDNNGIIGERLSESTPLYSNYGIQSSSIFLVDNPTKRILNLNLDSMTIQKSFALSKPENSHTLASGPNGSYVIDFSTKHLEVIGADGSREQRPFSFQGTPISAAFNPFKGILAMQDDLKSIGIMILSDQGKILKSWLGGPLIDKSKNLLAGDLDRGGKLVLAVSDKSISIVDVEASIDAKEWKSESFDAGIDSVNWLAPHNERDNLLLALGSSSVAVIDTQSKTVLDKIDFLEKDVRVVGQSKLVNPHVILANLSNGLAQIYYIGEDGKLTSHEVSAPLVDGYTSSNLDLASKELNILYSRSESHRITKFRLTDNLVILDKTITSRGDVRLGPNTLFVNKKSQLGYLQTFDLKSNGVKELKGFNFDLLRNK